MDAMAPTHEQNAQINEQQLVSLIGEIPSCLVAFSGGVDSAVVAKAAYLALGDRAVAATGVSASLAEGEFESAQAIARGIGIRHESLTTHELGNASYQQNAPDRCWHCKNELYEQMLPLARQLGLDVILSGANTDDLDDFRPGMQAAAQHAVRSPLAECGMGKADVRELARHWGLAVWDKPATPCLSSRVVYGLEVSPERLQRIDAAERFLRDLGLGAVRVRYHQDDLARLELPAEQLARLGDGKLRCQIAERLRELGFRFVTIDLEGFRSGSFQSLISPEQLKQFGTAQFGTAKP